MKKHIFYREGLRFSCTECGQCCSQPEGYVTLNEDEACAIADFLDLPEDTFLQTSVTVRNEHSLQLNSAANGDCIFLKENRCTIYSVRPLQCRTFPFWPENLKSAYRWKITAHSCSGINQGKLYNAEEIKARLQCSRPKEQPPEVETPASPFERTHPGNQP